MKISASLIICLILLFHGKTGAEATDVHSGKAGHNKISGQHITESYSLHKLSYGVSEDLITMPRGAYAIQLGAFRNYKNSEKFKESVEEVLPWMFETKKLEIIREDEFYKVRLFTFKDREEVNEALTVLASHELIDYQLLWLEPDQQQLLLQSKQDTVMKITETIGDTSRPNLGPALTPDTAGTGDQSETRQIIDRILYSLNGDTANIPLRADDEVMFPGFRSLITGDTINQDHDISFIPSPWLRRFDYFGKSVTLVAALILIIILSISTMLVLLVIILLNRRRMESRDKLYQYLLENYQQLILSYLYGESDIGMFNKIASNNYRRQVLIDQMKDVSVNLKGDTWEQLRALYIELGLVDDSVKKAHARRWHLKIKGFRELAFMNVKDANDEIYKCLNSRNEILRMEAQIALVRLSDDKPFEFLYHMERPFSLWEQITLHELIVQHNIDVPLFNQWLDSSNDTVIMFALRMIKEFRQMETEDDVRKVLEHPDEEVRNLAIKVAGDLKMKSTLAVLKRMYKKEDYTNSLEILRSMGKMPDEAYLGFLKLVLDKEDDVQLQIEATKAIENMGETGIKELVKLMKSEYKNYNIIIRHVLDRRIY